jgi:hypothetical protein
MKRAMIAVSARPSEAGEDGAEIVAASPDSGSFGPIRPRTNALDQDISHLMSVQGHSLTSSSAATRSAFPSGPDIADARRSGVGNMSGAVR